MIYREQDIIQWGIDRNILGPTGEGTKTGQQKKTEEEVREIYDAILIESLDLKGVNTTMMAMDAIGDTYVTLVMQAQMWGLTMEECIEAAWNQIKDRKGRMVNGIFVKEVPQATPQEIDLP